MAGPVFERGEYTAEEMRSWTSAERAYAEGAWGVEQGSLGIEIRVAGVEALAKSFETLSARAHKNLIPKALEASCNRLNDAIVNYIPVGSEAERSYAEGFAGEDAPVFERGEYTAEEVRSWTSAERAYAEGAWAQQAGHAHWRTVQSRIKAEPIKDSRPHTTTFGVRLPTKEELGIEPDGSFYPFNVEYGTRFQAAIAPIRRAVNRFERSEWGELLDIFGHGLPVLAMVMGPALLLRKVIFGRTTPKGFMPIDWSRARPGDSL